MVETTSNELLALRKEHLAKLRINANPFANNFVPTNNPEQLLKDFNHLDKAQLAEESIAASIAGRVILKRDMGKASFVTLQSQNGQLQVYIRQDRLGTDNYAAFLECDIGDILGATGILFKTNTGELSIKADKINLLTKSLRPLPDKHKGLADTEIRYRQRYLDLISNPESKERFIQRTHIINAIRQFFMEKDFLEVETPMMHPIPGGANARPFITHHNTLDMQLYLRIAPELYLKRLLVGGFERVFEINRNFRNEGVSTSHNPEFTMLEFYQAYATYIDAMDAVEKLISSITHSIHKTTVIKYQQHTLELGAPFKKISLQDAVIEYNDDLNSGNILDINKLRDNLQKLGIKPKTEWGWGKLLAEIFEASVEKHLIQPTFITDYPTEISPLARVNDDNPNITDRFELFIGGFEVANGFSELNDSQEQASRFKAQQQHKADGDDEAMYYDADYITALEHGMPPAAGTGIGIDRLVMLLTDAASIRDVLLFPAMRHRSS